MNSELEYITMTEARHATGLSEKTLKERLRGRVTLIGRNSYDRVEFFAYWKQEANRKREKIKEQALLGSIGISR